ncbi:MAG TPA: thiamine-phosphate kinase [Longimicrobiales bacterium]|nr:thiamine-phosphate kinase [Longimicrobiales bacterium]
MTRDPFNVRLGPGGEFDLIRKMLAALPADLAAAAGEGSRSGGPLQIALGPGDDCALLAGEGYFLAASTDLSVEGVHFRRDWLSDEEVGYRAAMAALSDLAAVAARPLGLLVSLAAPAESAGSILEHVMTGVGRAAGDVGAAVLGGDVSRSTTGLFVDVVVLGTTSTPILRRGAVPGDEIWVTGELGGAGAAVRVFGAGGQPDADARRAYASPHARVREALWLAKRDVPRAMIDVSDGLAGDLGHMAAASGVAIVLDREAVPVHPSALAACPDTAHAFALALGEGEDYELCFAAPAGRVQTIAEEFESTFGVRLTRVATVETGAGVWMRGDAGERLPLPLIGYSHFGAGS